MHKDCLFAQILGATDFSFAEFFFSAKKSEEYKPKDELWAIAKYYSKQQNDKVYKGFIIQAIITDKSPVLAQTPVPAVLNDDYLPF